MDCVFCKIIKKDLPSNIIYEDEEIVCFKDIKPSAPVHYLVVPKEHIESIMNLEDKHKDMIAKLIFFAKDIAEKINLKGYKLIFNVGKEGGQIIGHLHLHILGGWSNQDNADYACFHLDK